jgi:pimeloyl-ACP methyl ester carboxylesterase
MDAKYKSYFKDEVKDRDWFENWVERLEELNGKKYESIRIETGLGLTQIYGLNTDDDSLETLVIFPGARTTSLIWDLDNNLANLGKCRIYLVETNGLPNLSEGNTPDIKTLGYGEWAKEVFDKLGLQRAYVAGASFGALICLKLSLIDPDRIKGRVSAQPRMPSVILAVPAESFL